MPPQGFGLIKNQLTKIKIKQPKTTQEPEETTPGTELFLSDLARVEVQSDLSEIRCYGCQRASSDCTVPCIFPQKCFLRATDFNFTCKF